MKTLSERIRERKDGVIDNPYQGSDRKVLFACSAGILRSATAARIYAPYHNTRCAGSEDYALVPLTERLMYWADQIVFVNEYNYQSACNNFDMEYFAHKVQVLDIPDQHEHMAKELIQAFKDQYEDF